jgi:predicted nucleic acid-binding protein
VGFLDDLEGSKRVEVVHAGPDVERRALAWLRKRDDRAYSFIDATSFVLMRSMKIRDALAFDGDFTAAGFRELRT